MLRTSIEFRLVADQHRALQVAHVEEEEGFVGENFRVGELEGVEGTDRSELEDVGGRLRLAERFGNLFDRRAQHPADEIARFADRSFRIARAIRASPAGERDRRDRRAIEHEIFAFLVENREAVESQRAAEQFDRRVRLFDDAQKRVRDRKPRSAQALGAAAESLSRSLICCASSSAVVDLLRERRARRSWSGRIDARPCVGAGLF